MKKIDLGQTIAILANVGVLAGIVFLGIEVRQSTQAQDAATYQNISRDLQAIFDRLPVEIRLKVRRGSGSLDDEDTMEYALYTLMALRLGESWWQQWQLGTIDEEVFRSYITHIHGVLGDQVARNIWGGSERIEFMTDFETYINQYIAENPL